MKNELARRAMIGLLAMVCASGGEDTFAEVSRQSAQASGKGPAGQVAAFAPKSPMKAQSVSVGPSMSSATQPVARIISLQGSLMVSTPNGLVAGKDGMQLQNGARVVTTAKGSGILQYFDGCMVPIGPTTRVPVDSAIACESRIKLAQALILDPLQLQASLAGAPGSIPGVAAAAGGGLGGGAAAAGGLAGLGAAAAGQGGQGGEPVSPN